LGNIAGSKLRQFTENERAVGYMEGGRKSSGATGQKIFKKSQKKDGQLERY
jgi:hypothetical protein